MSWMGEEEDEEGWSVPRAAAVMISSQLSGNNTANAGHTRLIQRPRLGTSASATDRRGLVSWPPGPWARRPSGVPEAAGERPVSAADRPISVAVGAGDRVGSAAAAGRSFRTD